MYIFIISVCMHGHKHAYEHASMRIRTKHYLHTHIHAIFHAMDPMQTYMRVCLLHNLCACCGSA